VKPLRINIYKDQMQEAELLALTELCQEHGLPQAQDPRKYIPRPAFPEEAGLFYALPPEQDKQAQTLAEKPVIGRISFASGESEDFTDPEKYLQTIREELPYQATTGFRCATLTDDPAVRKAVDDMLYDLYGEENPRQTEDYEEKPNQGMTMGGLSQ